MYHQMMETAKERIKEMFETTKQKFLLGTALPEFNNANSHYVQMHDTHC